MVCDFNTTATSVTADQTVPHRSQVTYFLKRNTEDKSTINEEKEEKDTWRRKTTTISDNYCC